MRSTSPVSRPAWVGAVNALTGAGGEIRKSPVEIFADAASSAAGPTAWPNCGPPTLHELRRTTGRHWRVLNLSVSGALIRDVLADQLPQLDGQQPDLVTCGAVANDILYSSPGKLFGDLRTLLAAVPPDTVILDLPLLSGFWGIVGRMSVPYISRINRVISEVATERSLRVAEVSRHFIPPWAGKFAVDNFHPSQDGYRDWSRALVEAIIPGPAAAIAA